MDGRGQTEPITEVVEDRLDGISELQGKTAEETTDKKVDNGETHAENDQVAQKKEESGQEEGSE